MSREPRRVLILGAAGGYLFHPCFSSLLLLLINHSLVFAGRDFHNFQTLFRPVNSPDVCVGFTAAQIPGIADRTYPADLAGPKHPDGLPIFPEDDLENVIRQTQADTCLLSYSDLSNDAVMRLAARCLASNCAFELAPPSATMLPSRKPILAITAVRTGCGKSQLSKFAIDSLRRAGITACLVRHPMPYGDLSKQAVQRFASYKDLEKHKVTIEEREEYEQHISNGTIVFAGVDYHAILKAAESENVDVIVWDGGNNDTPFFSPDLWICVADPHRAGHEEGYFPGSVNVRMAGVVVINKANTAPDGSIAKLLDSVKKSNPGAEVFITDSAVSVDHPEPIKGKKVLVIEDGPTLTHGGMPTGAGHVAALLHHAEPVDPRPYLVGSLKGVFEKFPHLGSVLPAMGYWPEQLEDLKKTIEQVPCDAIVVATPMNLCELLGIKKECVVVGYEIREREDGGKLGERIVDVFKGKVGGR